MSGSIAKAQLESINARLTGQELRDKPEFDGHRSLVDSAIESSNGAVDKVASMAETQGRLVAFIVQQSLREPDRLATAFQKAHICHFQTDGKGNFIDPPWQPAIEDAIEVAFREHSKAADAPESSIEIKVPVIGTLLIGKGKAAAAVAGALGKVAMYAIVVGALLYWQSARFQEFVERRFAVASDERALNNDRAEGIHQVIIEKGDSE
jgi:hypothetical protein